MNKSIWITGVVLAAVIGYVAVGPYLTLSSIKDGIVENDSEKLSENIEFSALRQSIKEQLNVEILKNVTTEMQDNPFAAIGAAFATKMVDGLVDSFITPSGLAALMQGDKPNEQMKGLGMAPVQKSDLFKNAKFSYDSTSTFSVRVPNDKGEEIRFVLRREGFSWKLVNLVIPVLKIHE